MNWYCYILKCRDDSYYTGITNNLSKRIEKHNQGKGAKYTAAKKPVTLVWSRKFSSKIVSLKKENEIKGWSPKKKNKIKNHAGVAQR
jgi:putative endonuclease